jgi:hypothetical protein
VGISLLPNPSKPEITHGEFPFRLVYLVNGETKVIEDTLICDYDGIGMNEGTGKYRQWKERLASGNQKVLLLNLDGAIGTTFPNRKILEQEIYYDPGSGGYYMGESSEGFTPNFPNASINEEYQDGTNVDGIILASELLNNYKIKLISWDIAKPITNNFR